MASQRDDPPGWKVWQSARRQGGWYGTRDDDLTDAELKDPKLERTVYAATEDQVCELIDEQERRRKELGL